MPIREISVYIKFQIPTHIGIWNFLFEFFYLEFNFWNLTFNSRKMHRSVSIKNNKNNTDNKNQRNIC